MPTSTASKPTSIPPPGNSGSNSTDQVVNHTSRLVIQANQFVDTSALIPNGWARRIYKLVQPIVEGAFGFPALWRLLQESNSPNSTAPQIVQRGFKKLGLPLDIDPADVEKISAIEGPIILAANHPFGGLDALALIVFLDLIRPGCWKIVANAMVCSVESFAEHCIPLDPLGKDGNSRRTNLTGLHAISKYLKTGGMVGVFPAGRVSHRQKRFNGQVTDRPWNHHILRLAMKSGATVVCLHIPGHNSDLFLKVPPEMPKLRALLLPHQLTHPPVDKVTVELAEIYPPILVKRIFNTIHGIDQLRAACYLRPDLDIPRPQSFIFPGSTASVLSSPPPNEIMEELEAIISAEQGHLLDNHQFSVYFAQGLSIPKTLRALGCDRENTFRAAGQGTGKECDLSPEDDYYHHLILWDRQYMRLAGAYRIGIVKRILENQGVQGLYLNHVFEIKPRFYKLMGSSFELSRSYILPNYQGDPNALASLWKGIGGLCARYGLKTLFGSVTISNSHHPASRAILVEYLKANHADNSQMRSQVKARCPFNPATRYHRLVADAYHGQGLSKLGPVIARIENGQRGVPPLLRYYCNLNARFIDFHVESAFGNSLYCLLRVEIEKVPAGYRNRFGQPGTN